MPKRGLQLPRLAFRITHRLFLSALVGLCTVYVTACHSDRGFAPLPPGDGPLTGTWIQRGTDTWTQLDLSQSGARVVGYRRYGNANFGGSLSDPIRIIGTAALPQATLQWTEYGLQYTMNATISADGDSLTGTWTASGHPAQSFGSFQRDVLTLLDLR